MENEDLIRAFQEKCRVLVTIAVHSTASMTKPQKQRYKNAPAIPHAEFDLLNVKERQNIVMNPSRQTVAIR